MPLGDMNEIFMIILESMNAEDGQNLYGLKGVDIREYLSIKRSTRQVSSANYKNTKIPDPVIEIQNYWDCFEIVKGIRPNLTMVED